MFSTADRPRRRRTRRRRGRQSRRRPRHVTGPAVRTPSDPPHQGAFLTCCTVFSPRCAALAFGAFAQAALAANPQVEFDTTAGKIRIELYPEAAPKTVANFLDYVKAKHYDGTQFHRVIDGFMIQGGGFTADFKQKPTRPPVANEAEMASKAGVLNASERSRWRAPVDPNSATAAVLHQRRRQQAASTYRRRTPQGYRLHGVRQGRLRHGRRDQDREGAQGRRQAGSARNAPRPARRADRARHHQQGLRAAKPNRKSHDRPRTPTTAPSPSSSTPRTRPRPSRTSSSTSATATTTTRSSTA